MSCCTSTTTPPILTLNTLNNLNGEPNNRSYKNLVALCLLSVTIVAIFIIIFIFMYSQHKHHTILFKKLHKKK